MAKILVLLVLYPFCIVQSQWKMVLYDASEGHLFSNRSQSLFFASQDGTLYQISTQDDTWHAIDSLGQNSRSLFVDDSNNIFVSWLSEYVSFMHSTDAGISWQLHWIATNDYMLGTINAFNRTSDGALIASVSATGAQLHGLSQEYGDVFRSTDNGATWTNVTNSHRDCFGLYTDPAGNIFVGADTTSWQGRLYVSADSGKSFQKVPFNFPWLVQCVTGDSSGTLFVGTGGVGVYRYNGTWSSLDAGAANSTISSIACAHSTVFLGGDGLYYSTDNGDTWRQDSHLSNCIVMSLFVKEPYLYAVAKNAVWKRKLNDFILSVSPEALTRTQYLLNEAYPNPFNSSTIISFVLPRRSQVRLSIYDALGRHISTIVDAQLGAGNHQVPWNASNLTSGIYFARIQAGKFLATTRLVLIK